MIRTTSVVFILFFATTLLLVSCGKKETDNRKSKRKVPIILTKFVKPKPVAQNYVGSEACRQCHAEIMKEYESHPMSRSMAVTSDSKIENYDSGTKFPAGPQTELSIELSGNAVLHKEIITDSENQLICEHEEKIDYTCGSGTRGRSYFVFRNGKLFQSPVTWYAKSGKWDLSPGYNPQFNPRFGRMASDGCMACHAGRMNSVEKQRSTFDSDKPFHELSIGCERCHGPGQDHIDFHESKNNPANAVDPIVNPDQLSSDLRDAVCYQCHLQGENRIVRYGRSEYDFRPGMHISDVWITFLKSGKAIDGKTDAVSQVEQMRQSKCFTQSDGMLGCISCHDPHRVPAPNTQVEFYRNQCLNCHSESNSQTCTSPLEERKKESPQDSCIQCHMPKLNAGDVPHTAQTDHRVQIPGQPFDYDLKPEQGFLIWNDKQVPGFAIARAKTIARSEEAFMRSDPQLADRAMEGLQIFHPMAKDDLPLRESMAQLYSTKRDSADANRTWNDLLKVFPKDEMLLTQISLALHQEGKLQEAYEVYKRLFEVNNSRPLVLMRFLDVCSKMNRVHEGKKIATRILELDPGSKPTHQWLASAYDQLGEPKEAEKHRDLANRLPGQQ